MKRLNLFGKRRRGERGVAAIEFGFWLPILATMLAAILDLSYFMSTRVLVSRAAADGVRRGAAVTVGLNAGSGETEITTAAVERATDLFTNLGLTGRNCVATANIIQPNSIRKLQTNVTCDYTPLTGLTPKFLLNLPDKVEATFYMATEQQP